MEMRKIKKQKSENIQIIPKSEPLQLKNEHISRLDFNNGESLSIESGSIVVLVGPNNAGKSQALRDIHSCSGNGYPGIVISSLNIEKSEGLLSEKVEAFPTVQKRKSDGYTDYYFLGTEMTLYSSFDKEYQNTEYFKEFRDFFVVNLDTRNRLNICQQAENIDRYEPIKSPIQYVARNPELRDWLSSCFRKAFGDGIIPDRISGKWISLCIGDPISIEPSSDGQKAVDEFAKKLKSYPRVQEQGDGIKSFTGILLYLMLKNYAIYLIDEPEAFLHPPHAKVMGEIIGSSLEKDKQAFIATHSEELIKGLLETCPDRIKIVRITREKDQNYFHIIDNDQFMTVWNDPLLKYSNILSSLFYKSVVLCESDSDCKMYSIVLEYLKQQEGRYSETLFIHCGGKHRISKIAKALRTLGIFVKVVTDIDVLNDESVFRGLVESVDIDWNLVERDFRVVFSNIKSKSKGLSCEDAKTAVNGFLDSVKDEILSEKELKELRALLKGSSAWDFLKDVGSAGIPKGDATNAYNRLIEVLKPAGIYIVEVGELESFVKEVGGDHGPLWTNNVLEKYPDIGNPVYDKIREFVAGLDL